MSGKEGTKATQRAFWKDSDNLWQNPLESQSFEELSATLSRTDPQNLSGFWPALHWTVGTLWKTLGTGLQPRDSHRQTLGRQACSAGLSAGFAGALCLYVEKPSGAPLRMFVSDNLSLIPSCATSLHCPILCCVVYRGAWYCYPPPKLLWWLSELLAEFLV